MSFPPSRPARDDAGTVIVFFVLALAMVGALVALAVNIGRLYTVRNGLQSGADGAALAAAARLDGEQLGIDEGTAAATEVAGRHVTDGSERIVVDPADVTFGSWDRRARVFTPVPGRSPAVLRTINAVYVTDGREGARGNAVPILFGAAFAGRTEANVVSEAIAVGGGPCEESCAFPAAVAGCRLLDEDGALRCGQMLILNENYEDSLGPTSLEPGIEPDQDRIEQILADLQGGTCPPATRADDVIYVRNAIRPRGVVDEPYFDSLPKLVTVPVVDAACPASFYRPCIPSGPGPNSVCTNAAFVGDMSVTGYATFRLCHVTGNTVASWPPGNWPAQCGAAPGPGDFNGVPGWPGFLANSLFLQLLCGVEQPPETSRRAGCEIFGTSSPRSTLVR